MSDIFRHILFKAMHPDIRHGAGTGADFSWRSDTLYEGVKKIVLGHILYRGKVTLGVHCYHLVGRKRTHTGAIDKGAIVSGRGQGLRSNVSPSMHTSNMQMSRECWWTTAHTEPSKDSAKFRGVRPPLLVVPNADREPPSPI